jgi:hypothetical protein
MFKEHCFFFTIYFMPLPKRYIKHADITLVGMKRCVEAGGHGFLYSVPLPKVYVKHADIAMVGMKRCVEAGGHGFFYSILCPYLRAVVGKSRPSIKTP